jgi:hypothetical protein
MKIRSVSSKSVQTPIKKEKPLIKKTKLNPYKVSRGRGIR